MLQRPLLQRIFSRIGSCFQVPTEPLKSSKLGNQTSSAIGAPATNSSSASPLNTSVVSSSTSSKQSRARISGAPLLILLGLHKPLKNAAQKAREAVRKRHEKAAEMESTHDSDSVGSIMNSVLQETDNNVNNVAENKNTESALILDENVAATRIQSVARGRQVRKGLANDFQNRLGVEINTTDDNSAVNNADDLSSPTRPDSFIQSSMETNQNSETVFMETIDSKLINNAIKDDLVPGPQSVHVDKDQNGAAIRIQSVTRGRQVRKSLAGEQRSQLQQHFASHTTSSLSKTSPSPRKHAVYEDRISPEEVTGALVPIPATPMRQQQAPTVLQENLQQSPIQVDSEQLVMSALNASNSSVSEKRQHQIQLLSMNDSLSSDSGQSILNHRLQTQNQNAEHFAEQAHTHFANASAEANATMSHIQTLSITQSPVLKQQQQSSSSIVTKLLSSPPPARGSAVPSQIISSLRDAESKIEELKIELRVKEKMILELNTRCVRLSLKIAGHGEHRESMMASVEKSKIEAAQAVHDRDQILQEKSAMEAVIQSIRDEVELHKGLLRDHEVALTGRDKELFEREKRMMVMAQAIAQRDEEIRMLRKEMEESRTVAEARSGLRSAIARADAAETSLSALDDRFQAIVGECNELRSTLGIVQMAKTSTETIVARFQSQLSDVMEKNKKLQHSKSLAERKSEALVRYVREHVMPDSATSTSSVAIADRDESTSRSGAISVAEGGGGDDALKQSRIEITRKAKRIELLTSRVSELEVKLASAEQASIDNVEKAESARYLAKAAEKRAAALGDVLKRLKAAGVEVGLEQDLLAISKENSALSTRGGGGGGRATSKEIKVSLALSPLKIMPSSPAGSAAAAVRSKGSRPASVSLGTTKIESSIEKSVDGLEQEKVDEQILVVGNLINATESISADKERGGIVDKQGGESDEQGGVTDKREEQGDAVDEKENALIEDQAADIVSTDTPVLMTEDALSKSNEELTSLANSDSATLTEINDLKD